MKHQIQITSLEAWQLLQPNLGKRQQELYQYFKDHPQQKFTDKELAHNLKRPINTITNRRGELAIKGLIEKAGWVIQDKRKAFLWRLKK